jgi:DNA (cytosine-5)-methyltransferase 1
MIQTIKTSGNDVGVIDNLKIRKLTPLEAWRLMGIDDEDFNKAKEAGISDSQLYKQAGNAIVVDVLVHLFKNLF